MGLGSFLKKYTPMGWSYQAVTGAVNALNPGEPDPVDPDRYMPDTSALDALIARYRGYDPMRDAQRMGRSAGFNQGQFEQNAAMRGAGRNALGAMRDYGQRRAAYDTNNVTVGALGQLTRANDARLQQAIGGRMGIEQTAMLQAGADEEAARLRAAQLQSSILSGLAGAAGTALTGGFGGGGGMGRAAQTGYGGGGYYPQGFDPTQPAPWYMTLR